MNNYEYGFITKCAEYGVNPSLLIKSAGLWGDIKDGVSSGVESVNDFAVDTFKNPKSRNAIIGTVLGYLLTNLSRKGLMGYDKPGIQASDVIGGAAGGFIGYNADRLLGSRR